MVYWLVFNWTLSMYAKTPTLINSPFQNNLASLIAFLNKYNLITFFLEKVALFLEVFLYKYLFI